MFLRMLRKLALPLLLTLSLPALGCVWQVGPPEVVAEGGYEPVYYDGYVVYYDGLGRPYYYVDGQVVFVPRTYVHYDVLVLHYRNYRRPYHDWYVREGHTYKRYHRSDPQYRPPHYTPADPRPGYHPKPRPQPTPGHHPKPKPKPQPPRRH